jgi:hypothetical protein
MRQICFFVKAIDGSTVLAGLENRSGETNIKIS